MLMVRLVFLLLALAPANALAEKARSGVRAHGFAGAFLASRASGGVHVGGGGEVRFKRFAAGLEAGLFDRSPFLSVSGSFHAPGLGRQESIVPFFKGGVTALSSDTPGWIHFGGGFDYWPRDRLALRFEVRDHVAVGSSGAHVLGVTFGIVVR